MFVKNILLIVMGIFIFGTFALAHYGEVRDWSDRASIGIIVMFCLGMMWWDISDRPKHDPVKRFFLRLLGRLPE